MLAREGVNVVRFYLRGRFYTSRGRSEPLLPYVPTLSPLPADHRWLLYVTLDHLPSIESFTDGSTIVTRRPRMQSTLAAHSPAPHSRTIVVDASPLPSARDASYLAVRRLCRQLDTTQGHRTDEIVVFLGQSPGDRIILANLHSAILPPMDDVNRHISSLSRRCPTVARVGHERSLG